MLSEFSKDSFDHANEALFSSLVMETLAFKDNWGKFRRFLCCKFSQPHLIDEGIVAFKRFLILKAAVDDTSDKLLSPSPLVDELWTYFIQFTPEYEVLCKNLMPKKYGQKFIHRSFREKENSELYENTLALYLQAYKTSPGEDFWPRPMSQTSRPKRRNTPGNSEAKILASDLTSASLSTDAVAERGGIEVTDVQPFLEDKNVDKNKDDEQAMLHSKLPSNASYTTIVENPCKSVGDDAITEKESMSLTKNSDTCEGSPRRHGKWDKSEVQALIKGYSMHGNDWRAVCDCVPGRDNRQCYKKFKQISGKNGKLKISCKDEMKVSAREATSSSLKVGVGIQDSVVKKRPTAASECSTSSKRPRVPTNSHENYPYDYMGVFFRESVLGKNHTSTAMTSGGGFKRQYSNTSVEIQSTAQIKETAAHSSRRYNVDSDPRAKESHPPFFCKEVLQRLEAQSLCKRNTDGKVHRVQQVTNGMCHICHGRKPLTAMFICGISNHSYCERHLSTRLGLCLKELIGNTSENSKKYHEGCCPVCTLYCTCSKCQRRLDTIHDYVASLCWAEYGSNATISEITESEVEKIVTRVVAPLDLLCFAEGKELIPMFNKTPAFTASSILASSKEPATNDTNIKAKSELMNCLERKIKAAEENYFLI